VPDERLSFVAWASRTANRTRARGLGEVVNLLLGRAKEAVRSEEALILLWREASEQNVTRDGLWFRPATSADAKRYARDIGTDSTLSFTHRLRQDVGCFLVEDDTKILHSSWVTTTGAWTREIRGFLSPPPGDAYVYESFTRADARGRGIYPFALAGIVDAMSRRGVRRVWVGVEASNEPSRRAILKAGFKVGFELPYRRRLGRLELAPPRGPEVAAADLFLRLNKT